METDKRKLGELFEETVQWVVPVYQRHYVWESKEDEQIPGVWDDWKAQTEKLLNKESIRPHYFGAIIYLSNVSVHDTFLKKDLVDGQQRLTTFQLAFAALRDVSKALEYEKYRDIKTYISNTFNANNRPNNPDQDKYKLWPSKHDRGVFQKIIDNNGDDPLTGASELIGAYRYFCVNIEKFIKKRTEELSEEENKSSVGEVIEKLKEALLDWFQVVYIQLDEDDDAQQIFASLNGQAKPLSPFDLIRNDIFYRARGDANYAERLFEEKWFYFEDTFWSAKSGSGLAKKSRSDRFIIDAVIAQTAREVNHRRIVAEYQKYVGEDRFDSVSDELNVLVKYGVSYHALQKPSGQITERIANMLKVWDLSTMNPLVLWIDTLDPASFSIEYKQTLFQMIESYIIRRHICKLPPAYLAATTVTILTKLHEAKKSQINLIGTFKEFLETAEAETTRMPTDREILDTCKKISIYGDRINSSAKAAKKLKYMLEHIEKHIRTNRNENVTIDTGDLSIEHIMPQKWAENWTLEDGITVKREEWWDAYDENPNLDNALRPLMDKRQGVIHTIGNLTLVTSNFNSALSNRAWDIKRGMIEEESLLKLNRDVANQNEWNEQTIEDRSEELANHINKIWQHPSNY